MEAREAKKLRKPRKSRKPSYSETPRKPRKEAKDGRGSQESQGSLSAARFAKFRRVAAACANMAESITMEESSNGLAIITIDRPKALNAVNIKMCKELQEVVAKCEASSTVYPKTMCSPGCNDILHLQSEQHLLAI